MKKKLLAGVLTSALFAATVPGMTLAAAPQIHADVVCDGLASTRSGAGKEVRGWANRTYASNRKTCESGSLEIWRGWASTEPAISRSF